MSKFKFILVLLLVYSYYASGTNPITVNNSGEPVFNLNGKLSYWKTSADTSRNLPEAIIAFANNQYIASENANLNFGLTKDIVWLKFDIENSTLNHEKFIIAIENPTIKEIDFFQLQSNSVIKKVSTGSSKNFSTRDISYTFFLFHVSVPPQKTNSIYIKLFSDGESLKIPLNISSYKEFYIERSTSTVIKGIFYGLMIFVICFNVFLFLIIKERLHLYYNLFIVSMMFFLLGTDGLLAKIMFPSYPKLVGHIIIIAASLTNLFLLKLAQHFINKKTESQILSLCVEILIWVSGVIALFAVFGEPMFYISYIAFHFVAIITPIIICIISFRVISKIEQASLYFAFSFVFFTIGVLLYSLTNFGLIAYDQSINFYLKIGFATQVIILSFAITDRFRKIRDITKQELKKIVSQRINELKEQNEVMLKKAEAIEKTNSDLQKLSIAARETENGVMVADVEGRILFQNDGFKKLYNSFYEQIPQNNDFDIATFYKDVNIKEKMMKCKDERTSYNFETQIGGKNDKSLWVQTTITPIFDNQNELKHFAIIDTDITYSKKTEEKLTEKNINITQSIQTAWRLQNSILPPEHITRRLLPNSFVFFLPKDIVSGDFYFLAKQKQNVVVAAIDCTGHGVPGALMSIVAFIELNKAIRNQDLAEPSAILERMNEGINQTLKITNEDFSVKEGLDIALCSMNRKERKLKYAGAHNPLYLVRDNKLLEFKADRHPIGIYYGEKKKTFNQHEIDLHQNDMLYMFSDGFADQFGGKNNRKFLIKRFKETIIRINNLPINEQKEELHKTFANWKSDYEQVDDVLVMGFKV